MAAKTFCFDALLYDASSGRMAAGHGPTGPRGGGIHANWARATYPKEPVGIDLVPACLLARTFYRARPGASLQNRNWNMARSPRFNTSPLKATTGKHLTNHQWVAQRVGDSAINNLCFGTSSRLRNPRQDRPITGERPRQPARVVGLRRGAADRSSEIRRLSRCRRAFKAAKCRSS